MTTIFLLGWYSLGVIGCFLGAFGDRAGGKDVHLSDILNFVWISVTGPLMLLLGTVHFLQQVELPNIVVIKGKKGP
mgnify:CR=1 FL=1